MNTAYLQEMLDSHTQPLTNEELILLDEIQEEEKKMSEKEDIQPKPTGVLTIRFLYEVCQTLDNLTAALTNNDHD